MTTLKIINIILLVLLLIIGIDSIIKIKSSEGKPIEKVRKPLIIRIDIIIILTIILAILTIVNTIITNID